MHSEANHWQLEPVFCADALLHEALIVLRQSAERIGSEPPAVALPVFEFAPVARSRDRRDPDAPSRGAQNALQAIGDPWMGPYPQPKISMRIATRTRARHACYETRSTAKKHKANDDHPELTFSDPATSSRSTPGKHGFPTGPLASRLRKAGGGPVDNPATAVHHLPNRILCSENRSHLIPQIMLPLTIVFWIEKYKM